MGLKGLGLVWAGGREAAAAATLIFGLFKGA